MSLSGKPQIPQAQPVINDGFWPNLNVGDLISKYRVPSEYDQDVIKTGLMMALAHVNRTLKDAKAQFVTDGYASLAAYTAANSQQIDGQELLDFHYKNAVYCAAKANLLQQFNSLNRRPNAENAAKTAPEMEDHWLDESEKSIAEIIRAALPTESPVADHGVVVELL